MNKDRELKVGQTYKTRRGESVIIDSIDSDGIYCIKGYFVDGYHKGQGLTWTNNGKWNNQHNTGNDIIAAGVELCE